MKNYNFGYTPASLEDLEDPDYIEVGRIHIDYQSVVHLSLERPGRNIESINITLETAESIGLINWNALNKIIK